jgi:hypothetical protein
VKSSEWILARVGIYSVLWHLNEVHGCSLLRDFVGWVAVRCWRACVIWSQKSNRSWRRTGNLAPSFVMAAGVRDWCLVVYPPSGFSVVNVLVRVWEAHQLQVRFLDVSIYSEDKSLRLVSLYIDRYFLSSSGVSAGEAVITAIIMIPVYPHAVTLCHWVSVLNGVSKEISVFMFKGWAAQ